MRRNLSSAILRSQWKTRHEIQTQPNEGCGAAAAPVRPVWPIWRAHTDTQSNGAPPGERPPRAPLCAHAGQGRRRRFLLSSTRSRHRRKQMNNSEARVSSKRYLAFFCFGKISANEEGIQMRIHMIFTKKFPVESRKIAI